MTAFLWFSLVSAGAYGGTLLLAAGWNHPDKPAEPDDASTPIARFLGCFFILWAAWAAALLLKSSS